MHRRQDHSVKDRESLDCGQPGTVPLTCANVANLENSKSMGQDLKINTNTHAPALHTFFSPRIPRRHSYTDNPANEGAATPGGVSSRDSKAPNLQTKATGPSGLTLSQWPRELLDWKCT